MTATAKTNFLEDQEVNDITSGGKSIMMQTQTSPIKKGRKAKIESLFADLMKDLGEMEVLEKNIE